MYVGAHCNCLLLFRLVSLNFTLTIVDQMLPPTEFSVRAGSCRVGDGKRVAIAFAITYTLIYVYIVDIVVVFVFYTVLFLRFCNNSSANKYCHFAM